MGAANGESELPVFDRSDPRVRDVVNAHLVPDRFAQQRDEQRMLTCQPPGTAHIRKNYLLGSVVRIDHETLALSAAGQPVDIDPDVAQYPYGGRMQPFARQPSRRFGIRLKEGHPGTLAHVGQRAKAAYRAGPDDGHVVTR